MDGWRRGEEGREEGEGGEEGREEGEGGEEGEEGED